MKAKYALPMVLAGSVMLSGCWLDDDDNDDNGRGKYTTAYIFAHWSVFRVVSYHNAHRKKQINQHVNHQGYEQDFYYHSTVLRSVYCLI